MALRIRCDERAGLIEIHEPRLLRPGYEAFCRALVHAAVAKFGASRAEVQMESSTCRLEFEPGRFDRTELARLVAESVRTATPAIRGDPKKCRDAHLACTTLTASSTAEGMMLSSTAHHLPEPASSTLGSVATSKDVGRLADLVLAGSSLAVEFSEVITAGMPTVPLLLCAGRLAVRAAPSFLGFLMHQP